MKLKSTKWFKDFTSYTKTWSVIKGISGVVVGGIGLKWIIDSAKLNTMNWMIDGMDDTEVVDNFDEINKFDETK